MKYRITFLFDGGNNQELVEQTYAFNLQEALHIITINSGLKITTVVKVLVTPENA